MHFIIYVIYTTNAPSPFESCCLVLNAKNPLHTFPRNFPLDREAANLLQTCYGLVAHMLETRPTSPQQVVVMEFGKQHDTTDTVDFCPHRLVADLLQGNWCNGFWP